MLKKVTEILNTPINLNAPITFGHTAKAEEPNPLDDKVEITIDPVADQTEDCGCASATQIAQIVSTHNEAMTQIFKDALESMVDLKAIACVNIAEQTLLAMETETCLPREVLPLVAAATTDLFTAPNMLKVANLFKNNHGESEAAPINEIIVNGAGTLYLLLRLSGNPDLVCVFSCRDDGNTLGMLLLEVRALMAQIAATV